MQDNAIYFWSLVTLGPLFAHKSFLRVSGTKQLCSSERGDPRLCWARGHAPRRTPVIRSPSKADGCQKGVQKKKKKTFCARQRVLVCFEETLKNWSFIEENLKKS